MNLFAEDAYASLTRLLDPSAEHVLVDAGANVGNVSQRLAGLFPRAAIYSFEPVEVNYAALQKRAAKEPRIRAIHAALGASPGRVALNVNGCPGTSSVLPSAERAIAYHGDNLRTRRVEEVRMWSLDAWASAEGIPRVDSIKIDVQGYELEVLKGAERLLRESVTAIYSEAQMVPLYDGAALFSDIDLFLRERGFEMYQLHEIFSNGAEQRTTCCDALWVRSAVLAEHVRRARAAASARAA